MYYMALFICTQSLHHIWILFAMFKIKALQPSFVCQIVIMWSICDGGSSMARQWQSTTFSLYTKCHSIYLTLHLCKSISLGSLDATCNFTNWHPIWFKLLQIGHSLNIYLKNTILKLWEFNLKLAPLLSN